MNWPRDADWHCETCGDSRGALVWMLQHGRCICYHCGTEYMMCDDDGVRVTCPISQLEPEYKAPARAGWMAWHVPYSAWDDAQWDEAFRLAKSGIEEAAR